MNPNRYVNSTAILFRVLGLVALLLSSSSSISSAQHNGEYHFTDTSATNLTGQFYEQIVPQSIADGAGDTVMNLTMECLAANGYGQWTVSSNTATTSPTDPSSGWFLLANALVPISVSGGAEAATCIMGEGSLGTTFPTHVKVTANLDGRARYVWPDATGANFIVKGLNDSRGNYTGTSGDQQIDISFPTQTVTTPVASLYPVRGSVYTYTSASVGTRTVTSTTGMDYRDWFDVASDSNYVYIVWRTDITSGSGAGIYAMALNIKDNSVALGPTLVAAGVYPTVACDVRLAGSNPVFDVAYLTATTGGALGFQEYNGTSFVTISIPGSYVNPNTLAVAPYFPSHARALVSSILGSASLIHAIYVVTSAGDLILYKPVTSPAPNAAYCDGPLTGTYHLGGAYLFPSSAPFSNHTPGYSVVNEPICAFANPYDGQNQTSNFNQFHCLYRLSSVNLPTSGTLADPLMIIRGADNGVLASTSDTRLAISYVGGNLIRTDKFVAAVNQEGIHVHWFNTSSSPHMHYYSRDVRRFDEPIDENTILTFTSMLGDGTGHGGTNGARLLQGLRASMWSDPNTTLYNVNGEAWAPGGSELVMMDQNSVLRIGNDGTEVDGSAHPQAFLTTMPQSNIEAYMDFNVSTGITPSTEYDYYGSHTVIVNPASVFDCRNTGAYTSFNISRFPLSPLESEYGAGAITVQLLGVSSLVPAFLEVEPGANFDIGGNGSFSSSHAQIEMLEGYAVTDPRHRGSSSVNGKSTFVGPSGMTYTDVFSHIPTGDSVGVVFVEPCTQSGSGHDYDICPSGTQFTATYSDFSNSVGVSYGGMGRIDFDGNGTTFSDGACSLSYCNFVRFQVYGHDLVSTFSVENSWFDYMANAGILLTRSGNVSSYGNEYITNNTFARIDRLNGSTLDRLSGICVEYYDNSAAYAEQLVTIEDNVFESDNPPSAIDTAITLWDTRSGVIHNTIDGGGYKCGVVTHGVQISGSIPSNLNSLLCMNRISNCVSSGIGAGIRADNYVGYVKLNQVSSCDQGYVSDADDLGHIIFTNISNNSAPGIDVVSTTAMPDLTGVHGPLSTSGIDDAAYDTLTGNGVSQIRLTSSSYIKLGNVSQPWTWSYFCENNIIRSISVPDLILSTSGSSSIDNINQNCWGGVDPSVSSSNFPSVTYTCTGSLVRSVETAVGGSISCGDGFVSHSKSDNHQMGKVDPLGQVLTCGRLFGLGQAYQVTGEWRASRDTLEYYIEHCANDTGSFRALQCIRTAVTNNLADDSLKTYRLREWLKSVLYLNKWDPNYCCQCLWTIGECYGSTNPSLTVLKYLIDDPKCMSFRKNNIDEYNSGRSWQWQNYLSSGFDTSVVHLDTTLPSLHQLGLDSLLNLASVATEDAGPRSIFNVHTSNNPFGIGTEVMFELSSTAYVRFGIYDQLGRNVQGEEMGHVYGPGAHRFMVDGKTLANGTYYARLSTPTGEVRTVKLIKKD